MSLDQYEKYQDSAAVTCEQGVEKHQMINLAIPVKVSGFYSEGNERPLVRDQHKDGVTERVSLLGVRMPVCILPSLLGLPTFLGYQTPGP